jgi:4-diphosphocytidyl-2-C-methyl-D-erythritol kinase
VTASRILRTRAPAKINRELRVGPRRPDGFHEVRSRFVTIDLEDELEARDAPAFELICEPPELPAGRSNLVWRAAQALAEKFGVAPRARVILVKRIPVGAGLGGGSADAAVTLRLLARLWQLEASEEELAGLAASLGSDAPFFLTGGEAEVGGRGERVTPRDDGPVRELTLLVPPFPISTAEVYAAFDRFGVATAPPETLEIEHSGRFLGRNDLEPAVVAVRPEMGDYLAQARRAARECAVTGSGAALVLVGLDPAGREALFRRHPAARVLACRTLGRDDYRRRTRAEEVREARA